MYGLISLYLAYIIYLVIFFRLKKHRPLYKKITLFLGIKLIFLTLLYFAFFDNRLTRQERDKTVQNLIL
jgi:hypothetical protein